MITSISLSIPANAKVEFLKKIGDSVHTDETIATVSTEQNQVEINIAEELNVPAKTAVSLLMKNLGDTVEQDEVIARKKTGLLFKKTIEVKSLLKGKIFELDNFSGKVKIIGVLSAKNLITPVSGKIVQENDKEIIIEFKGEEIKPKKFFGKSFFARLLKISKVNEEVDSGLMTSDMAGYIILGGHFSAADLNKALALGVRAIFATKLGDLVFEKFSSEKVISMDEAERKMFLSGAVVENHDFEKLEKTPKGKQLYFDGSSGRIIIPA